MRAIEAVARSSVSFESSSTLSKHVWFSTAPAGVFGDVVTVFAKESDDDIVHDLRSRRHHGGQALAALNALLQLGDGWDSYGAPRISRDALACTLGFLNLLLQYPRGAVVPTGEGGIQLEWHTERIDLEIECLPSGQAVLSAVDSVLGQTEDRRIVPGHPAIDKWLGLLQD